MATPDVTAFQRSDLNEFLFADVGTEANGMTLSVVSLFARQGTDPWGEAGRLAALPKGEAADSLARSIATMPRGLWDLPAAVVIAARLTGLLPARSMKGMPQGIQRAAGWPARQSMLVLASVALAVACAVAAAVRPSTPPLLDGSDVASFSRSTGTTSTEGKPR